MSTIHLEVWSDIACPWCYVGKRRLSAALAGFAQADQVEVSFRAFELDPGAPVVRDPSVSYAARLAQKYGTSAAQAEAMITRMVDTAAADGIAMDFTRIRGGNTFDAHRLIALARRHGKELALVERLMRGYFCEGLAIGAHEALLAMATEVGLDADEVAGVLATDLYAADVRAEEREAQELGVSGVPFFVIDRRYGVSGAQPPEVLRAALERAVSELPNTSAEAGATCGPDGCV